MIPETVTPRQSKRPALPPRDGEACAFFDAIKLRLSGCVPQHAFATWFRPTEGRAFQGDTLLVTVPHPMFVGWITNCYGKQMHRAAADLGRPSLTFRLIVHEPDDSLHDGSIR